MSKKIPDFTDSQIWTVQSTLAERFKEKIETQIIDSEIRLHPYDRELTPVNRRLYYFTAAYTGRPYA